MRIGIVYHQFISEGGLERYLMGFVRSLVGMGHEVEVVTARTDEGTLGSGAKVHMVPGGRIRTARDLFRFDEGAGRVVADLDTDIVLGFGRTTRQDIHRAGGGCHKVYSRLLPPHRQKRRKNRAELDLEEKLYTGGGTRHFVVNSHLVLRQLVEEYGVSEDRLTVIRTAVDAGRFAPDPGGGVRARVRERLGSVPGRPVFLYAARGHRRKGLGVLLDAFPTEVADLWVAGPQPGFGFRRRLRDGIRFLGPERELADLLRAADFFVHPTRYDACANTVLQSMSCGLPALVSLRDGASEFVEAGVNGFLLEDPESVTAVREAVLAAIATPEDRLREMGENARRTVAPLTWERHVEEWLELIGRLRGE